MCVWHDNSGKGSSASWFLTYVIVRDLQTMASSKQRRRTGKIIPDHNQDIFFVRRSDVFFKWREIFKNVNLLLFLRKKPIAQCPMIICGSPFFLDHLQAILHVSKDALVALYFFILLCCSTSCIMIKHKKLKMNRKLTISHLAHSISVESRFVN
jgi:hypothetical protein